jgi:hypothetical protein
MGPEAKFYQQIKRNFKEFSLVKTLGPCSSKSSSISMYHGSRIRELAACGLKLDACSLGLDACRLMLAQVGSKA